ncbi:MAG: C-GCAxxG-C-C family protein [Candidatus Hodarchaeota archaeon]
MSKNKSESLPNKAYDLAFKYEKEHGGCGMAMVAAIQDVFGLSAGNAFKGATGLSGGVGGSGFMCGALTGGVIAIGLKYGMKRSAWDKRIITEEQWKSKEHIYERMKVRNKAHEFAKRLSSKFIEKYGSVLCHDIQKKIFGRSFDLHDPKDVVEFNKAGAHVDKCPMVVGTAARWVAEMLLSEEE